LPVLLPYCVRLEKTGKHMDLRARGAYLKGTE